MRGAIWKARGKPGVKKRESAIHAHPALLVKNYTRTTLPYDSPSTSPMSYSAGALPATKRAARMAPCA
jgi:hypothetical protein